MTEYDKEIISLAQQILGQPKPKSEPPAAQPQAQPADLPKTRRPAPEIEVELPSENTDPLKVKETKTAAAVKETKTAADLARMIEADLAKHPDCPRKGFVVTVYGATLWRAMLTITPAAGPVRNPQEWRELTEELAERLHKRYDLAWR